MLSKKRYMTLLSMKKNRGAKNGRLGGERPERKGREARVLRGPESGKKCEM